MSVRVADASVLAAIVFEEPRSDEAAALVAESTLHEPVLLAFELTNVAWKKARRWPEGVSAIAEALEIALSFDIRWEAVDQQAVLRLALGAGLSTYDASYLWVARRLGVPLLTFDRRLSAVASVGGLS